MRTSCGKYLLYLALCCSLTGCADGTFAELAALNPYAHNEWKEDEQRGPTFHSQLAELRAIRKNPSGLSPAEQAGVMPLLTTIVHESPNRVLRAEAVLTLGEFARPETIPTLQFAAASEDADLRIAASKAFGRVGGPAALEALARLVEMDEDLDVRLAATAELAKFPDQRAVQSLAVALNDKDPALQHQAVQGLKSVTGRNYGDSVPAWRDFVEGRTPAMPNQTSIADRVLGFDWF